MILRLEIPDHLAQILEQRASEINSAFCDDWTPETLAASFIAHILIDDEAGHSLQ